MGWQQLTVMEDSTAYLDLGEDIGYVIPDFFI